MNVVYLSKQIPENLVLVRASLLRELTRLVRNVEDITNKQQTVVHHHHLGTRHLLLTKNPRTQECDFHFEYWLVDWSQCSWLVVNIELIGHLDIQSVIMNVVLESLNTSLVLNKLIFNSKLVCFTDSDSLEFSGQKHSTGTRENDWMILINQD